MKLNDFLSEVFDIPDHKNKKEKVKREYRIQRGLYLSRSECSDLIYALNYAINSIKNKKDVVNKITTSTRYTHFLRWSTIRQKIETKLNQT